ncbi:MAG: exonuclease SbcCD subunit D [Clostridia bacterium]|nr:exonuclease SbcCD subunit D [Clostridia bacterium]
MKFLHIADLHLGKRVCEYSMLDEQRAALSAIVDMAVAEGVRGVLIAGDVYDRQVPPAEATMLLSSFLERLHEAGIAAFVIAGNHDSADRLAFASALLRDTDIFLAGNCVGMPEVVVLQEDGLRVALHMLPHFRPQSLSPYLGGNCSTSAAVMEKMVAQIDFSVADRHVLLAHLFVAGSAVSDSELPFVGTVDAVSPALFKNFDYVALGHLHRPQIHGDNVVYAGSPVCYSFSEVGGEKSAVLVDVTGDGVSIRRLPLTPVHAMREVRGSMTELMAMPYSEDYIRAVVTDEDVAPDARLSLRAVFPNLMRFAVENRHTNFEEDISPAKEIENRDPLSLFSEFFEAQNGAAPSEAHLALMQEIFRLAEVCE